MDLSIAEFADGAAIRFIELDTEVRIADPANRRFLDQKRTFRRRNQQQHELHAYRDDVRPAQAAPTVGEIFGHAAGMEVSVGIVDGIGDWVSDVASFVWTRCHVRHVYVYLTLCRDRFANA